MKMSAGCFRWGVAWALAAVLGGCGVHQVLQEPDANGLTETVRVLTPDGRLLRVQASRPWVVSETQRLTGLPTGEELLSLDYRVAQGVLYAVGRTGQVYRLDEAQSAWQPVGQGRHATALMGSRIDIDFNPTVDRIRLVSDLGQNLRLHPDTGLMIDSQPAEPGLQSDSALQYAPQDPGEGQIPAVVGAAYTYNTQNDKLTTLYVVDAARSVLAMQGSKEGAQPTESPDRGVLRTVGPLGLSPLVRASFDIGDVRNTALLATTTVADSRTRLYRVDLASGQAQLLGTLADGGPIVGLAIQP